MSRSGRGAAKGYLSYASINFGFALLGTTVSSLLMYYYTDVIALPALAVSGILFVARLFDGAVDPLLGCYMDGRTTRLGKYRGYVLYWAVPMCASFALLFVSVPFGGAARIIWCLSVYLLFTLAFSFIEISSLPMLASFSGGQSRSAGNTMKIFASVLATLIATLFSLELVNLLGGGSEQVGFARMAAVFAVVVLAAVLIGGARMKEGPYATADAPDKGVSRRGAILAVLKEKNIVFLLCMCLCMDAATAFKMQAGIYFLKYNMGRQDMTTLFLSTSIAASLLVQPLVYYLSKRVRLRSLMVWGCAAAAGAFLLIGLSGGSIALFMLGNCLYGMASAFPANLAYARMADLSDGLSARRGRPFGGVVNSFLGLASRIGSSAASALLTAILSLTAYVPNAAQSDRALLGISVSFLTLPVLALALGGLFAALAFHSFGRKAEAAPPAEEPEIIVDEDAESLRQH